VYFEHLAATLLVIYNITKVQLEMVHFETRISKKCMPERRFGIQKSGTSFRRVPAQFKQ